MKTFAKNLRKVRTRKGLTQIQLAERLRVNNATISKWESSNYEPNLEQLVSISKELDVSIDWLLGYEDKLDQVIDEYILSDEDLTLIRQLASRLSK
ncbi:helix-turn-helix domain-containing protein [Paenibacillus elgii]|uniref:helix-turn-helix domain-containing protein n=1 Tax=Paenibacillus elgii TaxID=189691 RepID=UPI0020405B8B|nr:helix-turn-helix transcriptional regulator [Paenibacillus elgii]MCM3274287.1 helix-turn-helix domain-containing protein [Paenibacillus elgii]